MLAGLNGSSNSPSYSSIAKLRELFPDKTKSVLTAAFIQLIHGVYNRESDKAKILSNHNSLNLIEFKIAIMKKYKDKFLFSEIKDIFLYLDADRTGRVLCDQFVTGIRVRLSTVVMISNIVPSWVESRSASNVKFDITWKLNVTIYPGNT